jgi:SAM-dependent methyltransferase
MQRPGVSALRAEDTLIELESLAFSLGPQSSTVNPLGLPATLPFRLIRDRRTGVISQERNEYVEQCLERAYQSGSLLGPAMDDTDTGRPYAHDFLAFVARKLGSLNGKALLEIGSGRGYLLKLLGDAGAVAVGLEPGAANSNYWRRFGVRVIQGVFPADAPLATYNAVLAYAVLEHIPTPLRCLEQIRQILPPGGRIVLAVPDCGSHIADCDSAMLVHEHFSYFTHGSLKNLLEQAGFLDVAIEQAGYGGAIYASGAAPRAAPVEQRDLGREFEAIDRHCFALVAAAVSARWGYAMALGRTLGVYCPLRALPYLAPHQNVRFFDDDPELWGRYYPPFTSPIESREQLLATPVDELWITSRTFGPKLRDALRADSRLDRTEIVLLGEFISDLSTPPKG